MNFSGFLADFFSAIFLCNCIPHLVSGLMGDPFPSPFASPSGKGNSSLPVNFLWGAFNLAVGCALYAYAPFGVGFNMPTYIFSAGFLLMGIFTAYNFGKVRKSN